MYVTWFHCYISCDMRAGAGGIGFDGRKIALVDAQFFSTTKDEQ